MIYLRARYMNPRLGIFLARDPWSGDVMRPGSMNGFGYVEGNPINFSDPFGLYPCADGDRACQNIQVLKPIIMNVAQRLNLPLFTNMTNNGFAAMLAAKALHEGRLKGDWRSDFKENVADVLGSDVRGDLSPGAPTSFGINNVYLEHPGDNVPGALGALQWWDQLVSHQYGYGPFFLRRDTLHTEYYEAKKEDFSDSKFHVVPMPSSNGGLHSSGWSVVPPDYYSRYTLANELTTAAGSFEFQGLIMLQQGWQAYEGYGEPICWGAHNGSPTSDISAFQIAVGVQTGAINRRDWKPYPPVMPGGLKEWIDIIPIAATYLDLSITDGQDYMSYSQADRQWFMEKGLPQP